MALTKVGKEGITGISNASDATAITITSGELVGIGVSSPQELLHLKDGDIVVGNGTASNSSSIGKIGFSTDSSNSRFIGIESFRGSDAANADLRFHTYGGDGNKGERMKIDTAGIMTVLSEGRAVTTSVQQGLIKTWINFNGQSTIATRDTFNITSITDNGQGDYTVTIANDMGNANYCATMGNTGYDGGQDTRFMTTFKAASSNDWSTYVAGSFRLQTKDNGNNTTKEDASLITVSVSGDLA